MADVDVVNLAAVVFSGSAVLISLTSILASWRSRRDAKLTITRGEERIKLNLETPEQAALYLKDFLDRHSTDQGEAPND